MGKHSKKKAPTAPPRRAPKKPSAPRSAPRRRRANATPQDSRFLSLITRSPRPGVTWNWVDILLIIALLTIAFLVSSNVMNSGLAQLLPGTGLATLRLALILAFYVIELLVLAYIAYRHRAHFAIIYRLIVEKKNREKNRLDTALQTALSLGAVAVALVVTRGVATLWGYLTERVGWVPAATGDILTMFGTSGITIWLAVISVVVLAPVIEEIIFRGVFLSALDTFMPPWLAIVLTSVIFALYHASTWALVPNIVLALVLGYLAYTRKTLWPAIFVHAAYNATLMAATLYLAGIVS
ncbi:MAG: CPBP family intramembrane metalloprotease [Coriobacteriia bacterium]|nr:CPBP family intramembrane metalloprotease [Coriobacteriia bacterium]